MCPQPSSSQDPTEPEDDANWQWPKNSGQTSDISLVYFPQRSLPLTCPSAEQTTGPELDRDVCFEPQTSMLALTAGDAYPTQGDMGLSVANVYNFYLIKPSIFTSS